MLNGKCECGCGETTTLSLRTANKENIKKGQYRRFCYGHQNRRFIKNHNHQPKRNQFYHSGYIYILAPKNHPFPTFKKYIKRSRFIMEQYIGRYLKHEEYIHHINGIRDDDRIENLQITTLSEHNKIHKTKKGVGCYSKNI